MINYVWNSQMLISKNFDMQTNVKWINKKETIR